jgi:hypothetical protein
MHQAGAWRWGPNFGDKWHDNAARYWACRNGVPVETIRAWQLVADEEDMATEINLQPLMGRIWSSL